MRRRHGTGGGFRTRRTRTGVAGRLARRRGLRCSPGWPSRDVRSGQEETAQPLGVVIGFSTPGRNDGAGLHDHPRREGAVRGVSRPGRGVRVGPDSCSHTCLTLNVGAATTLSSRCPSFPACRGLCGVLCGVQASHAVVVGGVVFEAFTEPGLQHSFLDDADSLTVPGLPPHGHPFLPPVPDGAAGASDEGRGFPVGESGHRVRRRSVRRRRAQPPRARCSCGSGAYRACLAPRSTSASIRPSRSGASSGM